VVNSRWWTAAATAIALALGHAARADTAMLGLAEANLLLRFTAERPGEVAPLRVTGVGGTLLGIDVRPLDQTLYGVTTTQDLYAIDLESGVARLVSTLTQGFEGSSRSGFDFNPQADRLRLIAASGQNLRVHVALGAVALDGPLAYGAGDRNAGRRPRITAAAYTSNVPQAKATQLFDIDSELDILALQDPPNDGGLRTVGPLGIDFGPSGGFDIVTGPGGAETAYAVSGAILYTIDLTRGTAKVLGTVGDGGVSLIGLAAGPGSP
jgi:hypothetical protein